MPLINGKGEIAEHTFKTAECRQWFGCSVTSIKLILFFYEYHLEMYRMSSERGFGQGKPPMETGISYWVSGNMEAPENM